MSNNNHVNYNKMSNNETNKPYLQPTIQTITKEELKESAIVPEEIKTTIEEIKTDVAQKTTNPKPTKGKVINCTKLNLRKGPSVTTEVAVVLKKDDEVVIDTEYQNDTFYKVRFGVTKGFCMKEYIEITE